MRLYNITKLCGKCGMFTKGVNNESTDFENIYNILTTTKYFDTDKTIFEHLETVEENGEDFFTLLMNNYEVDNNVVTYTHDNITIVITTS